MATKVSEITGSEVAAYIRLDEASPSELQQIETFIVIAKSYVKSSTGLDDTEVDSYPDLMIAVFVLCQDMYDNRAYYVESNNVNKVADSIMNLHRRNFVPSAISATADNLTTDQNVAVSLNPLANDCIPFGSIITQLNGTTPVVATPITIDNASVVLNIDTTITVTPATDFVGTFSFEYVATTPDKATVTSRVVVVVREPEE